MTADRAPTTARPIEALRAIQSRDWLSLLALAQRWDCLPGHIDPSTATEDEWEAVLDAVMSAALLSAQEIEALREQMICGTCGGLPHASGKPCVCTIEGPKGTVFGEIAGLRRELFGQTREIERLRAESADWQRREQAAIDEVFRLRKVLTDLASKPYCNAATVLYIHRALTPEDRNGE